MKDDPLGMEHAAVNIGDGGLVATSTAFGTYPVAYRLELELRVDADWVTRRLGLTASGDGWSRSLVLTRDATWRAVTTSTGDVPPAVIATSANEPVDASRIPPDVLDVDVQYSPLTNVMPIRRLGLDRPGTTGSFLMAWASVPSLTVSLDPQHYTLLGTDGGELIVRFESGDGSFTAKIRCDSDAMVVDYPGIARRLA
jgi:hypothetical protein